MRVFAIADLHLSFSSEKPMDVFGEAWRDHAARLDAAWRETVAEDDLVLVPGDISWAIRLDEAAKDLAFLSALPGQKLILRGNHDYWWSSATQVQRMLGDRARVIQNDAVTVGSFTVGGTRGWTLPGAGKTDAPLSESAGTPAKPDEDRRIYERELLRLELSLKCMEDGKRRIAMLHFPPTDAHGTDTAVTGLLERYGVEIAVYGHLHGRAHRAAFIGERNGVKYAFAAADYLAFRPLPIAEE